MPTGGAFEDKASHDTSTDIWYAFCPEMSQVRTKQVRCVPDIQPTRLTYKCAWLVNSVF